MHTDVEKFPDLKLNLYSLRHCETLFGVNRKRLQFLAENAGSFYRPFLKREKAKPFPKKLQQARKHPRRIDNPNEELKAIQKTINAKLLRPLVLPYYLCGGVSGKSILDNVLMHLDAPLLVTIDIKNFFPSITNKQIYNVWRELLDCSPQIAGILTRLTTFERRLPQGAPTSTLLANLVLCSIDSPIRAECVQRNVTYSTWVDDLAFSGGNTREIIDSVVKALQEGGFSISHRKLKLMEPGTRKVLNGILLGRFPSVLRDRLKRLRSGIYKLRTGQISQLEKAMYIKRLESGIIYVSSLNDLKSTRVGIPLSIRLSP